MGFATIPSDERLKAAALFAEGSLEKRHDADKRRGADIPLSFFAAPLQYSKCLLSLLSRK